MTLPAFAAERRRLQHGDGRHQSIALGALLQAPALISKPVVAAVDRWDRRTDGRPHTTRICPVSVNLPSAFKNISVPGLIP